MSSDALARAADELDIMRATSVYALGLDRHQPDLAIQAFADDAVWDARPVGLERFEGREQILDFFQRDAESVDKQFHIMTNHLITFDSDDAAHGTCYVYSEAEMNSGAKIKAIALNEDKYVRSERGWVIAERIISQLTTPDLDGFEA